MVRVVASSSKGGDKAAKNSLEKQGLSGEPRAGEGEVVGEASGAQHLLFVFVFFWWQSISFQMKSKWKPHTES